MLCCYGLSFRNASEDVLLQFHLVVSDRSGVSEEVGPYPVIRIHPWFRLLYGSEVYNGSLSSCW